MVPGDFFSSLMTLRYCVLHVVGRFVNWNSCVEDMCSYLQLLEFEGDLARKLCFHILHSWNVNESIARKLRFHDQIFNSAWELEGRLARKLRFHIFNFSN